MLELFSSRVAELEGLQSDVTDPALKKRLGLSLDWTHRCKNFCSKTLEKVTEAHERLKESGDRVKGTNEQIAQDQNKLLNKLIRSLPEVEELDAKIDKMPERAKAFLGGQPGNEDLIALVQKAVEEIQSAPKLEETISDIRESIRSTVTARNILIHANETCQTACLVSGYVLASSLDLIFAKKFDLEADALKELIRDQITGKTAGLVAHKIPGADIAWELYTSTKDVLTAARTYSRHADKVLSDWNQYIASAIGWYVCAKAFGGQLDIFNSGKQVAPVDRSCLLARARAVYSGEMERIGALD